MEKLWHWAKAHPYATAGIVFAVALILYFLFRGSGSSAASSTDPYSAYYDALAASTASGNQLAAVQNSTAAQTAQTQIAYDAQTQQAIAAINGQVAATTSANNAAVQIANTQANSQNTVAGILANLGIVQSQNELQGAYLGAQVQTQQNALASEILIGQQQATTLQNAIAGITSISTAYNAQNLGNTLTPPGADTLGNLVENQVRDIGQSTNAVGGTIYGLPSSLAPPRISG